MPSLKGREYEYRRITVYMKACTFLPPLRLHWQPHLVLCARLFFSSCDATGEVG